MILWASISCMPSFQFSCLLILQLVPLGEFSRASTGTSCSAGALVHPKPRRVKNFEPILASTKMGDMQMICMDMPNLHFIIF